MPRAGRDGRIAVATSNNDGDSFTGKTIITGNPVRPAVLAAAAIPYRTSAGDDPFELLVFGGSQGAQYFSEAMPAAIALLEPRLKARLRLTQQARPEDEAAVRLAYAGLGIAATISPFFTDMADRLAAAQFIVSRSGASTVSEIAFRPTQAPL